MKVGLSLSLANTLDWDRFVASEHHEDVPGRPARADIDEWDEDVALGVEAEPLGFDSIFVPEHHFTPYSFSTNPLQFLTYFAGRTERIDLGTMVVVLPWHHPLRVAEEAVMLQNFLGADRNLLLGLGRGLARREYDSFGVDMNESRARFREAVEILRLALTEDRFSYDGEIFQIPEMALRPYPRDDHLLENLYCAWGSPQSAPLAAEAGLKPFIIPTKAFADYEEEMGIFARTRTEHGHPPAKPMVLTWVYCGKTEEEARAGARTHMYGYARTPVLHYELAGAHFSTTKGYEHYAAASAATAQLDMAAVMGELWLQNHVWGTPEQCFEKIQALHQSWDPSHLVCVMRYGSMPYDEGRDNMHLFAKEVLPAVKELGGR